ncbi:MAG: hypothetical protein H7256_07500 [Bdellovibrio sp.]|nr:hypothetical protein [Bdellovibrio sp.]
MSNLLKMGLEISTESGAVLRPTSLKVSVPSPGHISAVPQTPFKYYTDAIIGISFHKMTDFKHLDSTQKKFAENAYTTLNPYVELFKKSSVRMNSIAKMKGPQSFEIATFEKKMFGLWQDLFTSDHVDFTKIPKVLNLISDFENQTGNPFLYNFSIDFSTNFKEKLVCFYSFLFNLRSVIAIDHNAYIEDSSIESVKTDCITDYLPKSDYTINDALLFLQFKRLSVPFAGHKGSDVNVEKLFVQPLEKYFYQYNHNACCLIDQLPPAFLSSLSMTELEETLHHVQMDWLLGSSSGLLFKIREELFGMIEGYDKVFWPETQNISTKSSSKLVLSFQITIQDLAADPVAA